MENNSLYIARLCAMRNDDKKKTWARIADYISANLESTGNFTIDLLAEKTDTSYATVCRFLKEIGVSGIKEFKKIILSEIKQHKKLELKLENYNVENGENLSYDRISDNVCDFSASVVANCCDALKEEMIEKIITLFDKANFIYFVGLGTSAVTALYAYTKMFRLKLNCSFDTDIIISKMKASVMKKGDVLFVISSSGRTKPIVETAKIAKQNGAAIISLCDFFQSPLAGISDISICTTIRNSNKYLDVDFPLIQGQITIIDILYSCIYNRNKALSAMKFNKTTHAVRDDKIL